MDSFEQLLRRFQTPVLHFLRRRGLSVDAEDVTQETFMRVYENLHRYNRRWAFSTWLFTIARRTSLNHRRRSRPTTDLKAVEAATSVAPGPLDVMVADENCSRFWDRVAGVLSEEQTTALWLHYVEDMPVRAIAKVLGRSWASVKVMLFRARKRLMPLLGEFDDERRPADCPNVRLSENGTVPFTAGALCELGGTPCKGVVGAEVDSKDSPRPFRACHPSLAVNLEVPYG